MKKIAKFRGGATGNAELAWARKRIDQLERLVSYIPKIDQAGCWCSPLPDPSAHTAFCLLMQEEAVGLDEDE